MKQLRTSFILRRIKVIPMMTSLNAGLLNVILCLAGGIIFTAAIGGAGKMVLDRTDIL